MSATVAHKVDPMMVSTTLGASPEPEPPPTCSEIQENQHSERKKAPMKKVTFDLDLEIHTIPQRIPIYEKRPASHVSYPTRGNHPQAFLPRPLDLRGRDRHLLGVNSTRKIIDLFNLPNGVHNYPFSPKVIGRSPKRSQNQNAATVRSTYPPTNSYTPKQPLSRAAFNLKQLSNALGEHFDESVYEWDYTSRARKQIGGSAASMASASDTNNNNNSKTKTSVNDNQAGSRKSHRDNAIAAFSPSKIKTSTQRSSTNQETLSIDRNPSIGHGKQILQPSYAISTASPHFNTASLSIKSGQHQLKNRRNFKTPHSSRTVPHTEITSDRTASPSKDTRASSRCSTIDTYVISDVPDSQGTGTSSPRSGSASAYRRRPSLTSPKKATVSQVAWGSSGASETVPITGGISVASQRTGTISKQQMPAQPQWEVLARPAKLSSTPAQH